ncbi:hypothetical protein JCM3770_000276 [Rhodotorula araucariae]
MPDVCASCHAVDSLEYAPELGTLACTRCGTVSTSSATHAFEFLGRVDAEDDYQNGRTFVGAHGGAYGGVGAMAARRAGAKVGSWTKGAEGGAGIYQAQRRTEAELFIRRLLTRFDLFTALRDRTRHLFERAKARLDFRWGRKSEIFAAACVYVAAREANKPVWLLELASLIEVKDINVLTRAVRVVKFELKVEYDDDDPAMFIERLLVHLNKVFSQQPGASSSSKSPPPPPPLHTADKRKTAFAPANATWIRSIPLPAVRDLATGLLALAAEQSLTVGRPAETVAAAAVIAALEGTARRPAPVVQEFADELAWALGSSSYAVSERYRELNRLLVDLAAKLPWNAATADDDCTASHVTRYGRPDKRRLKKKEKTAPVQRVGRKTVKTDVVAHTADVVAFRKTLASAQSQLKPLRLGLDTPGDTGNNSVASVALANGGDEGDDDESVYIADPLVNQTAADRYYGTRAESLSLEPQPADSSDTEDPTKLPASSRLAYPPPSSSRGASPSPAPAPAPSPPATARKKAKVRATPYVREGAPPAASKRMLRGGVRGAGAGAGGSKGASGSESGRGSGSATPAPSAALAALPAALDPHVRQLLLAGVDLATAARHLRGLSPTSAPLLGGGGGGDAGRVAEPTTRLGRLLWAKPADEIADDELFDPGELEAYLRPRDEARRLLALPWAKEMIAVDEAHVRARAAAEGDGDGGAGAGAGAGRPRHRPYRFSAPRDAHGNFVAPVLSSVPGAEEGDEGSTAGRGAGGGRKRRAGTAETDGFRPRKKRTKITNREALEAYLARDAASDDESAAAAAGDGDGDWDGVNGVPASAAREGGEAWQLGMALQAAQDEGEDVDDDLTEAEEQDAGGDDWRKAFGAYGAVEDDMDDDDY